MIRTRKLEARQFFLFHFKGTPSQDQQKTFRRRLITFKVTLLNKVKMDKRIINESARMRGALKRILSRNKTNEIRMSNMSMSNRILI